MLQSRRSPDLEGRAGLSRGRPITILTGPPPSKILDNVSLSPCWGSEPHWTPAHRSDTPQPESVNIHRQGRRTPMSLRTRRTVAGNLLLAACLMASACAGGANNPGGPGADPELASRGSIEVTARLVEIPEKAIFERELYNYATVLKYEVISSPPREGQGPDHLRRPLQSVQAPIRGGRSARAGHRRHSQVVPRRPGPPHGPGRIHDRSSREFHGRDPQQVFRGRHRPDLLGRLDEPGQRLTGRRSGPCATSRFHVPLPVTWPG